MGATLMNQESSRSHSIFTITVETLEAEGGAAADAQASSRPAVWSRRGQRRLLLALNSP